MADISVTAANVIAASDAVITPGLAGATITAGQAVYLDTADNRWKLADADSATVLVRSARGIALNGASSGQPLSVQTGGTITIGGTVVAGITYLLSDVAGGIRPSADAGAGDYTTVLGVGISATQIKLGILNSGTAI